MKMQNSHKLKDMLYIHESYIFMRHEIYSKLLNEVYFCFYYKFKKIVRKKSESIKKHENNKMKFGDFF